VKFLLSLILIALVGMALASEKGLPPKLVDSGSFGVFNGAHRVATETFSIKHNASGRVSKPPINRPSWT
jgi:hypothetical protein